MNAQTLSPPSDSVADLSTVHQILLAARDAPSALDALRAALADSGAELCGLTLKPVGEIVEASLRIRRLGEAAARLLVRDLTAWPGVTSARVEHLWGRG